MKKIEALLISLFLLVFIFIPMSIIFADELEKIEKNGVIIIKPPLKVEGKVCIAGNTSKEKIKILVRKGNKQIWYNVDLNDDKKFEKTLWLTEGKGEYTISVMVHEYDRKYSYGPTFKVINTLELDKYLTPSKDVESDAPEIITLAKKLTEGKNSDIEKMRAIYEWVVKNIEYDFEKYSEHQRGNYNNVYGALNTLKTRKGVCYDFAALTAALGRAAGVKVKLVKGEGKLGDFQGLHTWNEFFSEEENKWINIDTTFGAVGEEEYFDNEYFNRNHFKIEEY
ncbi:transglutaminase domain-containing protein [Thermovenabulum sp.]|uniref:transglutaminase domain-containing protein n=1 Tax=Thermovenabulum sp. TaxID=3100335 RepID=UPI003C7CD767